MIFDLKTGKRRKVVQIVFGFLAFIFFISFVGFGIGSDVSGGIFDAIGLGGGSSGDSGFEQQIEDAEEALEADPEDRTALVDLVNYHYLAANEIEGGVSTNETTGLPEISEDARSELTAALDAWDRYLATDPQQVSAEAALDAYQVNDLLFKAALGAGDAAAALRAAEDAAEAGRIAAKQRESASDYVGLANYLYVTGDVKGGDAAADKALELIDPSSRDQLSQTLKAYARNGAALNKELEKRLKQGDAEGEITDPFGSLGGGQGAVPPPASP